MTQPTDGATCFIRSTLDADGKAACLMEWGPVTALLSPEAVIATARDLLAAAAAAEVDVALVDAFRQDLGARDEIIGVMLTKVRGRRAVPRTTVALRIAAVAGAKTGQPLVHIARGSMKGELTPDGARGMALTWITAATAAQIDVRTRYALGQWDRLSPDEIEQLFQLVQSVQR